MLALALRVPASESPPGSPTGPLKRETPAYRAFLSLTYISFHLSLRVPGKVAPSMFPNRVPMGSDTSSPEPLFYFSFIHSCMSAGAPKKEPSYIHMWKNVRSPSTEPHADGRPTYNGVRLYSPRGSLGHCYLYPSAT